METFGGEHTEGYTELEIQCGNHESYISVINQCYFNINKILKLK